MNGQTCVTFIRALRFIGAVCFSLYLANSAHAVKIAVYGDNQTDNVINTHFGAGSATLVTDAQLSTVGFLSAFDAVYVTRDGAGDGPPLSAAASANVKSYVGPGGNVVLLVGDYSDTIGFSGPAD